MVIYITFGVVVFSLIMIFFVKVNESFKSITIAIEEAEINLESILKKKFDLLNKAIEDVKGIAGKNSDMINDIVALRSKKISNQEFEMELSKIDKAFHELVDSKIKLKRNKDFMKSVDSINDVESGLRATKNYYNMKVTEYNKLARRFPSNIVALFLRHKKLEHFNLSDEKENQS